MTPDTEIAIVGAGPYGLAVASHLLDRGSDVTVFGEPLGYWTRHMPAGMRLRSSWRASSIASPQDRWSLGAFERAEGAELDRPVPLADFLRYGSWFQRNAVPSVDPRRVKEVSRDGDGFALELEDGGRLTARRVVLATGLERFARRPAPFDRLPGSLVSHTADHTDPAAFRGRRIAVVGAGQSAIEFAALVHRAGAHRTVVARAAQVHWLTRSARLHGGRWAAGRVLYAPTDVGPAGLSWVVAAPGLMRRLPPVSRDRASRRCVRPAASDWLQERLEGATVVVGAAIADVTAEGHGVRLRLAGGRSVDADHVVLGTGFQPTMAGAGLLRSDLLGAVDTRAGLPVLRRGFETSVPGLHVVGALSIGSFGPVVRFVSGTWYTAPALSDAVARRARRSAPMRTAGARATA
jgi:cation diffusion facilitator CzcD-associated flavoprotein CzcO